MDDFAEVNYVFPSLGYVANITVFDAAEKGGTNYLQHSSSTKNSNIGHVSGEGKT